MVSAVLDWDLSRPLGEVKTLPGCDNVVALVRWRGRPLTRVRLSTLHGRIDNMSVWRAAQKELGDALTQEVLPDLTPVLGVERGLNPDAPSCSVVVCRRDRPADLWRCLQSICLGLRPGDAEDSVRPPRKVDLDLDSDLDCLDALFERNWAEAVHVLWRGASLGRIEAVPGAERLTGHHVRKLLIEQFPGPVLGHHG
jgi:hypothetical protein